MADITPALQATTGASGARVYLWETLTAANAAGAAILLPGSTECVGAFTVTGTPDSATAVLQGSNDGTNWFTMLDKHGTATSLTAAGAFEFATAFKYIRPSTSGGGGSQDLDVIVTLRN